MHVTVYVTEGSIIWVCLSTSGELTIWDTFELCDKGKKHCEESEGRKIV